MANHSKCVVCQKSFVSKFGISRQKVVCEEAALEAYVETGIYIPSSSRCCTSHLSSDRFFKKEALIDLKAVSDSVAMTIMDATVLVEGLRKMAKKNSIFSKFEIPTKIDDKLCLRTTGLSCDQFNEVYNYLGSMCDSKSRTKSHAFAVYLF